MYSEYNTDIVLGFLTPDVVVRQECVRDRGLGSGTVACVIDRISGGAGSESRSLRSLPCIPGPLCVTL